jgi:hypothetical protein
MVTQMLRQEDADAFKLYSQAKLGMMREALAKLDRKANERAESSRSGPVELLYSHFSHGRPQSGICQKEERLITKD